MSKMVLLTALALLVACEEAPPIHRVTCYNCDGSVRFTEDALEASARGGVIYIHTFDNKYYTLTSDCKVEQIPKGP